MAFKQIFIAALIGGICTLTTGCANSKSESYKQRPGWSALKLLAYDDCNISKKGGKSLIEWGSGECSADGLISSVNRHPEKLPAFYAAYHQYGTPGVRAIDVSDSSKMNYLNFARDLSSSLNQQAINKIYDDYVADRSHMGLVKIDEKTFTASLNELSSKKDEFQNELNLEAMRLSSTAALNHDEKLGVDYKAQCGPFKIDLTQGDGWARINSIKPETQKITPLPGNVNGNNIQMQWMVQRADAPGWFGMDYVKRNGKAILNVEAIRSNMDQPRVFGSFDCVKIN